MIEANVACFLNPTFLLCSDDALQSRTYQNEFTSMSCNEIVNVKPTRRIRDGLASYF